MKLISDKKAIIVSSLCLGMFVLQSFVQKEHHKAEKPQNLKVLPKDISEDDLHNVMKTFSKSLGVRCNYCHVSQEVPGQEHPKFDFPADDKPEKNIAREMMKMTEAINTGYLAKIGDNKFERITCVTCHNGKPKPNISIDSLMKK